MKLTSSITTLLILLASVGLHAEEPPVQPAIRSDLESVLWWKGRWEGLVSIWVNGKTNIVNYYTDFTVAPGGKALYSDELIVHPEIGNLKRQNVIDYQEKTRNLRWVRTDYLGKIRVYTGSWVTPKHFHFEAVETLPTGQFVEKVDFIYTDSNRVDAYQIATLNGVRIEVDSGYFARRESKADSSTR